MCTSHELYSTSVLPDSSRNAFENVDRLLVCDAYHGFSIHLNDLVSGLNPRMTKLTNYWL